MGLMYQLFLRFHLALQVDHDYSIVRFDGQALIQMHYRREDAQDYPVSLRWHSLQPRLLRLHQYYCLDCPICFNANLMCQ